MTWTKLSDDYSDDCWTLSDRAFRLHTEALIWSNRKLLDCIIPKDDMPRLTRCPDAADELVAIGWWTDDGATYTVRHHAGYQISREGVLKLQERNRKNGAKGGRPKKSEPPDNPDGNPRGNPDGNPTGNPEGRDGTGTGRATTEGDHKRADEQISNTEVEWPEVRPPGSGRTDHRAQAIARGVALRAQHVPEAS